MKNSKLVLIIVIVAVALLAVALVAKQRSNVSKVGVATPLNTASTAKNIAAQPPATESASTAQKNISPCSLLTKGEVEAVLGQPAKEPELHGSTCTYDTVGGAKYFYLHLGSSANWADLCKEGAKLISDLGDAACVDARNVIWVLKKDVYMSIDSYRTIDQDTLMSLAGKAVNRVP